MPALPRLSIRLHGGMTPQACVEQARAAEAAGIDAIWFAENPFARGIVAAAAATMPRAKGFSANQMASMPAASAARACSTQACGVMPPCSRTLSLGNFGKSLS